MIIDNYGDFKKRFHYRSVLTQSSFRTITSRDKVRFYLIQHSNLCNGIHFLSSNRKDEVVQIFDVNYQCNFGFNKTYNIQLYELDDGSKVLIPRLNKSRSFFPYSIDKMVAYKEDPYIRMRVMEQFSEFVFDEYEKGLLFKNTEKSRKHFNDPNKDRLMDLRGDLLMGENQLDFYNFMIDNIETMMTLQEL